MLDIRERRLSLSLSVDALAKAAGVSARTIFRIEQDPTYATGLLAAQRIARALETTVDDLIRDEPEGASE